MRSFDTEILFWVHPCPASTFIDRGVEEFAGEISLIPKNAGNNSSCYHFGSGDWWMLMALTGQHFLPPSLKKLTNFFCPAISFASSSPDSVRYSQNALWKQKQKSEPHHSSLQNEGTVVPFGYLLGLALLPLQVWYTKVVPTPFCYRPAFLCTLQFHNAGEPLLSEYIPLDTPCIRLPVHFLPVPLGDQGSLLPPFLIPINLLFPFRCLWLPRIVR